MFGPTPTARGKERIRKLADLDEVLVKRSNYKPWY